ncbi:MULTISPECIES: DsbE family thiol:disulfide interchange protein [Idiomarinaceae]|uniref:DsbE family thiol:disulfide interchange protein n=1 Tax=Pseudidiomarina sp. PP-1MA TaxID=3237706 RepID=A0AB39X871_9GAMM|nr:MULTISPECIES: DsbE family thiol:disulfide interchange protein [Idiomarina]MRJ41234.1 DsbE family thiol:disulfide interchange protein [Idiomarina sp. FeN1]NCU56399.1 DsbE family thiol:disulfide interchange protein [Idiomarina sp. FenA--70]NCU59418.1 DsbE family thiol:disulfide interchange protein [Idiomarina sp. FenBw--71]UUN12592.1 DsbE family thiol:disulfide interchange protein [Idiomarina loihiensis]
MAEAQTSKSSLRWLVLALPLVAFLALTVFLLRGLFSDPTELSSALVGKPVPAFSLPDIYDTSTEHTEAVLKTGEPLLLNVWATWCPTCRAEHAFLNELAAQGIPIVGLNYKDDSRAKAVNWLNTLGDPYVVNLFDERGMVAIDFGVYGAPETFLINHEGEVVYRHVGDVNARNWSQLLAPMFQQLQQQAKAAAGERGGEQS